MAVTINASPSNGLVQTADGSGVLKVQSNGVTTNALAWVNFAGASGTRNANYNVSSITRNAAGDYTVNFTNTLSDANYVVVATSQFTNDNRSTFGAMGTEVRSVTTPLTTSSCRVGTGRTFSPYSLEDALVVHVAVFGN